MKRYYGTLNHADRQSLMQQIVASNPSAKNLNTLYANQLLKLDVPRQYCAAPEGFPHHFNENDDWFITLNNHWMSSTPAEREVTSLLTPVLLGGSSAKLAMLDRTFKNNAPLLREMVENYELYKSDGITKGQYDYRRRKLVNELSNRLGPTQWLLNGKADLSEILRIDRHSANSPTAPLKKELHKITNLSRLAAAGGIALTAVSLSLACEQIANASSGKEKNEILLETLGSTGVGFVYSLGATFALLLSPTPVGWIGALVIAVGGAALSYSGGKAVSKIYSASGVQIDLASASGVTQLCKPNVERKRQARPIAGSAMRVGYY